jgi:hypothetical protein
MIPPKRLFKDRSHTISRHFECGPNEKHLFEAEKDTVVEKTYWDSKDKCVKTVMIPERKIS